MRFPTAVALGLICSVLSPASAAVLKVPAAFPTIQQAVDAAGAGDVVRVYAGGGTGPNGEYQENVVIDALPITLQCLSAVIDVSTTTTVRGGVEFSAGITVTVAGVTVRGCTVQFAQRCLMPACLNIDLGDGIDVDADDFSADGNVLVGNDNDGLSVKGDRFVVRQNTFRSNDSDGLAAEGNDGTVSQNLTQGNDSRGISVNGHRSQILNNGGERDDSFVEVEGNDNEMRANHGRAMTSYGFRATGQGNTLTGNVITFAGNGFVLRGSGFNVTGNRAESCRAGLDLTFITDSTLTDNISRGSATDGFRLRFSSNVTLLRNQALDNGSTGFELSGEHPGSTLVDNVARNNGADGFGFYDEPFGPAADCTDSVLRNNIARRNVGDGFDLDCTSTGVELVDNVSRENGGTGIENDAAGTDMLGNTALGNRTDIAGAGDGTPPTGTVGLFGGNAFDTGGPAVATPNTGPADR